MGHTLKLLGGTLLFLLEIDDLALVQHLPAVALVVFGNGAVTDANLLAYLLERVAFAGVDIIVFVIQIDGVEGSTAGCRLVCPRVFGDKLVVLGGAVV